MLMAGLNGLLCLIKADLMEIFHMESFIKDWQAGRQADAPSPQINYTHIHARKHHDGPRPLRQCLIHDDTFFICLQQINLTRFVVKLDKNEKGKKKSLFLSRYIGAHFWHYWSVTMDRQQGKLDSFFFFDAWEDASEASHRSLMKSDNIIQMWL